MLLFVADRWTDAIRCEGSVVRCPFIPGRRAGEFISDGRYRVRAVGVTIEVRLNLMVR